LRYISYGILFSLLLLAGCGDSDNGRGFVGTTASTGDSASVLPSEELLTVRVLVSILPRDLPADSSYIRGTGLASGQVVYQQTETLTTQTDFEQVPEQVDSFKLEFVVAQRVFGTYEEPLDRTNVQDGIYTITDPPWADAPPAIDTLDNLAVSTIRNLSAVDANTIWLVGDRGTLMKTIDGGRNFQFLDVGTELDLKDVFFLDQQQGWIVAGNNQIFSSVDGGESWSPSIVAQDNIPARIEHKLVAVRFLSSTSGVVGGDWNPTFGRGVVLQTQDSGSAWTPTVQFNFSNSVFADFGGSGAVLYACGARGILQKSLDQGASWASMNTGLPGSQSLRAVDFESNNNQGYTLAGRRLFYTSNGGSSWQEGTPPSGGLKLTSVAVTDTDEAVAVGGPLDGSGVILRTTDGGANWTRVTGNIPDKQFEDVEFVDTNVGFAVSSDGVLIRSEDGGLTWSVTYDPTVELTDDLLDVDFAGPEFGAIVGVGGLLLRTTNGGETFAPGSVGQGKDMFGLDFVTSQLGFSVGTDGEVWRTTDGGEVWELVSTGFPYGRLTLRDIASPTSTATFAVGDSSAPGFPGTMARSTDGGRTWSLQTNGLPNGSLFGVGFADPSTGIVVGEDGLIATTTDGAETWTARTSGTAVNLHSVYLHENGLFAVAVGDEGTILLSQDAGATWSNPSSPTTQNLRAVHFSTERTGVAAGFNGTLLETADGGLTWSQMSLDIPYNLYSAYLNLDTSGLLVGENGGIIRLTPALAEIPPFVGPPVSGVASLNLLNSPTDGDIFSVLTPVGLEFVGDSGPVRTVTVRLEQISGSGATLSGTLTRETFNGAVTFDDLVVDRLGTYQLVFGSAGFEDVVTQTFSLTDSTFDRFVGVNGLTLGSASIYTYQNMSLADGNDPPDRSFSRVGGDLRVPTEIAVSASRNILFVSDPNNNFAQIYPLDASGPSATIGFIGNLDDPHDLQYDSEPDRLFVVERDPGQIRVRDNASLGGDGSVGENRFITGLDRPTLCRYVPKDDRLFVLEPRTGSVYVIDQASSAQGTIASLNPRTISGFSSPASIDYDRRADTLYVQGATATEGSVSVVENASSVFGPVSVSRRIALDSLVARKVVLDPVRDIMYLLNQTDQRIEAYHGYSSLSGPSAPDRTVNQRIRDGVLTRMDY
jgi:photosystem II stability/assembly factor-like uncharacterized protein